ncbi:hypothetical protein HYV91_02115 [Candidatus Wolfebacteria bacterium]|nr:hypothetical protein [Candidatus Wolfebacteria bacterium]
MLRKITDMSTKTLFTNALGMKLDVLRVAEQIAGFMKDDQIWRYKVVIGSDSEGKNGASPDFVTAIVVHRVGNGGRYFWRRVEFDRFFSFHDRIIQEVVLSLESAKEVLARLEALRVPLFDLEIHVDVGENGETKSMMQEVLGMVRAYNFEARTKPDSYAATKVADRHV